jgi:hypothetical protein
MIFAAPAAGRTLKPVLEDPTPQPEDAGSLEGMSGVEMAALLDRIPGAWERIEAGTEQARAGETIPLEEI